MAVTTAVILAAGMGTRLKEFGKLAPKGFLQLGNIPIVEESIIKLLACNIQRIIIITGHLSEFYQQLQKRYPQKIFTVHNPEYAQSGSMYSLHCAHHWLDDDFLLLESDLIYEKRALEIVLNFPKDNVILLSEPTNAGDEVYVETNGTTIVAMSKNLSQLSQAPSGELVGISLISQALFQQMLQYAKNSFHSTLKIDYETDALVRVAQIYPVYYTVASNLLWTEIDDEYHLSRAKNQIYPAILRQDR
ncbi:phosphocholine cytidylyltransferase family protein [Calothrix sp. UHCC 0171]|uniref:phosphocholine cytidylyltransferase family protein n=1 Tax=Calothrix sp. UHCC 0171 TaxID=3110245 RepID=UPI002B20CDC5|nr:phosphocholine cytidylyltransferase family protein [Calothrix sp. UHCC 0171]MEA5571695.1 phosphocholine cytidylyltransferase family protein [Calothrix sp. UHCC 0171]